ncbi:hypothetical protein QJQ45_030251 [Haematococcus lacustris]|nr:hypothetical protein QJQ45_030251 [Haematococcus lacustris]
MQAYIHSRNIIHRCMAPVLNQAALLLLLPAVLQDLKPDNVLLQDSPDRVVAKVCRAVGGRPGPECGPGAAPDPPQRRPCGHSTVHGAGGAAGPQQPGRRRVQLWGDGLGAAPRLHCVDPAAPDVSGGGCLHPGLIALALTLHVGVPPTAWPFSHALCSTKEPRYLQGFKPHPQLFHHDWRRQPVGPAAALVQPVLRGLQELVDCCLQPRPSARPSFAPSPASAQPKVVDSDYRALNALNTALNALNTALNALNIGLSALNIALNALNLALNALNFALNALNIGLNALNIGLSALNLALNALNIALSALNLALNALNIGLNALNIALSALNIALNALNIGLSALNLALNALNLALKALNLALKALNRALNALNCALNALNCALNALNSALNALNCALDALNLALNALNRALNTLNNTPQPQPLTFWA